MSAWPADFPCYMTPLPTLPSNDIDKFTKESTRLPIQEGCLISELVNGQSGEETNCTVDVRWQPPAREIRHPAQADSDEPDACRADAQVDGIRSCIRVGAENETERARTEDRAGGRQAEERRGRTGMQHAAAQDRGTPDSDASMRVWRDILFTQPNVDGGNSNYPAQRLV